VLHNGRCRSRQRPSRRTQVSGRDRSKVWSTDDRPRKFRSNPTRGEPHADARRARAIKAARVFEQDVALRHLRGHSDTARCRTSNGRSLKRSRTLNVRGTGGPNGSSWPKLGQTAVWLFGFVDEPTRIIELSVNGFLQFYRQSPSPLRQKDRANKSNSKTMQHANHGPKVIQAWTPLPWPPLLPRHRAPPGGWSLQTNKVIRSA
jgi:hypothetical protein